MKEFGIVAGVLMVLLGLFVWGTLHLSERSSRKEWIRDCATESWRKESPPPPEECVKRWEAIQRALDGAQ